MKLRFSVAAVLLFAATFTHGQQSESFKVGAFNFNVPEGWTKVQPSSPMRNAQLEIAQGPAKAEVTFFHFGAGASGTPEENVTRWFAQFPDSQQKRDSKTSEINGVRVTLASAEGTFRSGMPGAPTTPMPDYALAGAILQHPNGDVYVKMTGPVAIVKGASEAFQKMIGSAAESLVQTR